MIDRSSNEQSPFDTWSKLIESTMKGNPALQAGAQQAAEGGKDPWITLIDQLWRTNPYRKLVPLYPAEITRAFHPIRLHAARNPDHSLAPHNRFGQPSPQ